MTGASILFIDHDAADLARTAPPHFTDLYLDQIVNAIVAGKEFYDLKPFFYEPLHDPDAVAFRHEVLHDLDSAAAYGVVRHFAWRMESVRKTLGEVSRRYNQLQKMRWFLNAAIAYGTAVEALQSGLQKSDVASRGLRRFSDYLAAYTASPTFRGFVDAAHAIDAALSRVRYSVFIEGLRVTVEPFGDEADYGAEVANLFARFEGMAVKPHAFEFGESADVNQVEGNVLRLVARAHPEEFTALERYYEHHRDFLDPGVVAFDSEAQFYLSYLDYIARLKDRGLPFCYPRTSAQNKTVRVKNTYDLALAQKLIADDKTPVPNDIRLEGSERIIVVTGPNQGGKTTFARTVGQLHYLASLGLPVPGSEAQLYLPDAIFAHFERAEAMTNLTGKLQDDVVRIHAILEAATTQSLIIINEIFASTTLADAIALSRKIARKIAERDTLSVWVTFIDEIASEGKKTVSMVSTVDPDNPEVRTFKIVRQPADGLAYALSLARKYRLTQELLAERLRR